MSSPSKCVLLLLCLWTTRAFVFSSSRLIRPLRISLSSDYAEYDVVEYRLQENDNSTETGVGVVLANGKVQPLCVWAQDGNEFVWDEDAETLDTDLVVRIVDDVWPTTRLVDGGLGPNNPHGEESEDVFVIERDSLSASTTVVVKTDREVFW